MSVPGGETIGRAIGAIQRRQKERLMRTREGGLWWIVVALAGVLGAARDASAQATMVFSPDRDNTIYEDVLGGASNGAGDHIFAGRTNNGQKRRALVRFDLSLIPPGSTIVSASLRLHLSQARTDSGNQTVTLHR
ncbi:MAG: DNRLRE domain-containing protein, partial [Planctomycetes bacterium]|nr:DNRLRE domain-containing protein [Planctomycetota bacterium]